jgi:hypothetical protein
VKEAHAQVASVRDRIQGELDVFKQQQHLLRSELHRQVQMKAPKRILADLTKRLKQLERNISDKEKLYTNIERDTTQLQDTSTNTSVAAAMMQSVEAQRSLQKLDLGDHIDIDDMLDGVEENRQETRTLTNRLGKLGDDVDAYSDDEEDTFDANDVLAAMGMQTSYKDDALLLDINEQMSQKWQRPTPAFAQSISQADDAIDYGHRVNTFPDAPGTRKQPTHNVPFFNDLQ